MDVVDRQTRSRMMSGIRGGNTRPECLIRCHLHRMGFRFRIHGRDLPGKPDVVLPRWRAVVLVHGCFWHRHECRLFKWPSTRTKFWRTKLNANHARDQQVLQELEALGWRVCVVWECALKGSGHDAGTVAGRIADWLREGITQRLEIADAKSDSAGILKRVHRFELNRAINPCTLIRNCSVAALVSAGSLFQLDARVVVNTAIGQRAQQIGKVSPLPQQDVFPVTVFMVAPDIAAHRRNIGGVGMFSFPVIDKAGEMPLGRNHSIAGLKPKPPSGALIIRWTVIPFQ